MRQLTQHEHGLKPHTATAALDLGLTFMQPETDASMLAWLLRIVVDDFQIQFPGALYDRQAGYLVLAHKPPHAIQAEQIGFLDPQCILSNLDKAGFVGHSLSLKGRPKRKRPSFEIMRLYMYDIPQNIGRDEVE